MAVDFSRYAHKLMIAIVSVNSMLSRIQRSLCCAMNNGFASEPYIENGKYDKSPRQQLLEK